MIKKRSMGREFIRGIIYENPIFVLVLGLCPTLGVTTTALNGLFMGLATAVVLVISNTAVSALRRAVPETIRIPAYLMVMAAVVTALDMIMHGYFIEIYKSLGIYIPLIVVNCLILARAEVFASKNGIVMSAVDGLAMGSGFAVSLTMIGAVREILGRGTILAGSGLDMALFGPKFEPAIIMVLPPGAFLTIGVLKALINKIGRRNKGRAGN